MTYEEDVNRKSGPADMFFYTMRHRTSQTMINGIKNESVMHDKHKNNICDAVWSWHHVQESYFNISMYVTLLYVYCMYEAFLLNFSWFVFMAASARFSQFLFSQSWKTLQVVFLFLMTAQIIASCHLESELSRKYASAQRAVLKRGHKIVFFNVF